MPRKYFSDRINELLAQARRLESRATRLAVLRIAIFLSGTIGFIYFINDRDWQSGILVLLGAVVLFLIALKRHLKVRFQWRHKELLIDINKDELKRLDMELQDFPEGNDYKDQNHPYTSDLDIFGSNSLFQLLNRTTSFLGENLLVDRLKSGLEKNQIPEYQKAVHELVEKPDWSQKFIALGNHEKVNNEEISRLIDWSRKAPRLLGHTILRAFSFLLPAAVLILLFSAWYFNLTYYIALPPILANILILGKYNSYAKETVEDTFSSIAVLKVFKHQMSAIAELSPESNLLKQYTGRIKDENQSAEKSIARLQYLLSQLEARTNMLHIFFNMTLLLDVHWLYSLEKWRKQHGENLNKWMEAIAEFEYLTSLSATSFANPAWAFAKLSDEKYCFKAKGLGHPLLRSDKSITNDFSLVSSEEVVLLTGPNMAGKSTFLRTVAINIVLARMAAPVTARSIMIDPDMQVFTAMRVADALSENVSSFYAEIYRIGQLLDLIKSGEQVLFFLDEILKGTNSADRHKGAEGLIKQLIELQASGFVSTHDIELGELTQELHAVHNYSFESIIEGNEISFDYKLRDGICQSFNACALMRQMGIDV